MRRGAVCAAVTALAARSAVIRSLTLYLSCSDKGFYRIIAILLKKLSYRYESFFGEFFAKKREIGSSLTKDNNYITKTT